MEDKHYAVLIDADNISSKYIAYILDEMTKYGVITYKRIYGDWTSPQAGRWKDALMENSLCRFSQFRNTGSGKCNRFHIDYRCHGYFVYGECGRVLHCIE